MKGYYSGTTPSSVIILSSSKESQLDREILTTSSRLLGMPQSYPFLLILYLLPHIASNLLYSSLTSLVRFFQLLLVPARQVTKVLHACYAPQNHSLCSRAVHHTKHVYLFKDAAAVRQQKREASSSLIALPLISNLVFLAPSACFLIYIIASCIKDISRSCTYN